MTEADLKLKMIRLIDKQEGQSLQRIYEYLLLSLSSESSYSSEALESIEDGYERMSKDEDRESQAMDWIEGTLDSDSL